MIKALEHFCQEERLRERAVFREEKAWEDLSNVSQHVKEALARIASDRTQ